jgi:hypothetical protein
MGFTENVANKQLETFSSQMKLLESAFTDVAIQIGEELTPHLQKLIPVLQRLLPEIGDKMAAAVAKVDWARLTENIANFFIAFVENIDTIVRVATNIGILAAALVTYTTFAKLAATATAIWTGALVLNPVILMATAVLALAAAIAVYSGNVEQNRLSAQTANYQTKILSSEIDNLNRAFRSGAIDQETYNRQLQAMQRQMNSARISTDMTAGELNRMNSLRLDGAIKSMNDFKNATSLAERQAKSFNDSYNRLEAMGAVTRRTAAPDDIVTSTVSSGPSAFEQARKKIQDVIKSSQKQLNDAQKTFISAQITARQTYADNILRIEKDFSSRLSGIIQQSQERLRNAYKSAVETNLAALFDRSEDKSVAGLVKSLSDKLTASRTLLSNSAELASQGFSQTFIEQIVSAGTETGNELASAILKSTPETQGELRKLFTAIESEADSGMDSLANEIFQKQGFATRQLASLYRQTGLELTAALFEQQKTLDKALLDANQKFVESVTAIRNTLQSELNEMKGQFGGLEGTIDSFIKKLNELIVKYKELANAAKTTEVAPPTISFQPDMPSGGISFMPIGPGVSTGSMPAPTVGTFPQMPLQSGPGLGGNTFITINAKADTSQSLAMVGKSLGSTVAKYVTGGGQVIVSNV